MTWFVCPQSKPTYGNFPLTWPCRWTKCLQNRREEVDSNIPKLCQGHHVHNTPIDYRFYHCPRWFAIPLSIMAMDFIFLILQRPGSLAGRHWKGLSKCWYYLRGSDRQITYFLPPDKIQIFCKFCSVLLNFEATTSQGLPRHWQKWKFCVSKSVPSDIFAIYIELNFCSVLKLRPWQPENCKVTNFNALN